VTVYLVGLEKWNVSSAATETQAGRHDLRMSCHSSICEKSNNCNHLIPRSASQSGYLASNLVPGTGYVH
jgi:hypothetical protein